MTSAGCIFFANGHCHYGDKCKFSHNIPSNSFSASGGVDLNSRKSSIRCRNLDIQGFCRLQGKGCEYNHDPIETMNTQDYYNPVLNESSNIGNSMLQGVPYGYEDTEHLPTEYYDTQYPNNYIDNEAYSHYAYTPNKPRQAPDTIPNTPTPHGSSWEAPHHHVAVTSWGTFYYPTKDTTKDEQSIYIPSLPHVANQSGSKPSKTFFINEKLEKEYLKRVEDIFKVLDQKDPRLNVLPPLVSNYHSLYPLDNTERDKSVTVFGHVTHLFKCINVNDRMPYAMRRIDGFHLSNEHILSAVSPWKQIQHPNIVKLRDVFSTKEFNDNSIIFIYDYHPKSTSLLNEHFIRSRIPVAEDIIWSYLVQLVSALRVIHKEKLSCRVIHPSKIILTGKNRIRISGVGILDTLNYSKTVSNDNVLEFQKEDLIAIGQLLLCICNRNAKACEDMKTSLNYLKEKYSKDLSDIIIDLISMKIENVYQINSETFMSHVFRDNTHLHDYSDFLENEITKQLESGRLFRLLTKLGFINDRPEYQRNSAWSESGDRHILTLFRDYIFHQEYENGLPIVDLAHVIDTLNKLDAGSAEKIVLVSRNEKTVITVSFAEIKICIENAFKELQMSKNTFQGYS